MNPTHPSFYEIRDPIHKTILIDEQERQVLDHAWVQRLRYIRQLGFTNMVYPGAVHDRFQHSLGVMHLAGECFKQLIEPPPAALTDFSRTDLDYCLRIVRLAGLLHDSGHAPFSHASESLFPPIETIGLPVDWFADPAWLTARQSRHEDMSLAFLAALPEQGVLETGTAQDVASLIDKHVLPGPRLSGLGPMQSIIRNIISGEIDADRCDYLLRDSHFTGVSYGVYDLPRLLACQMIVEGPDGPELGLDIHGVHTLEGLLLARYHMFLQVYFHKTTAAFEYYLEQAIEAGEIEFPLHDFNQLIGLRDDRIISQIYDATASGAEWSSRIVGRVPSKLLLRERMDVASEQTNLLPGSLIDELQEAGCHVFQRRSRQTFTQIAGAGQGDQTDGQRLLCERRVLGRSIVEPITAHSPLLSSFNHPIDLRLTYVLREHADKASRIMQPYF